MKEKWVVTAKRADFNKIAQDFHINPVLARLIVNRDVREYEDIRKYLYGTEKDFYDPLLLKDLKLAADMLLEAVENKEKIAIASDFDVDGIMSGFILKTGFSRIGADCMIYTPDRVTEGYGLNCRIVEQSHQRGARRAESAVGFIEDILPAAALCIKLRAFLHMCAARVGRLTGKARIAHGWRGGGAAGIEHIQKIKELFIWNPVVPADRLIKHTAKEFGKRRSCVRLLKIQAPFGRIPARPRGNLGEQILFGPAVEHWKLFHASTPSSKWNG